MKHLRNKPIDKLSENDVKSMLQKHGFYESFWNESGEGIEHTYKKQANGEIVFDGSTGLYWQQSGSLNRMTFENAQAYVSNLNDDKLAGYADWRLPTLEEAMSLMESEENNDDLYIDSVFDARQDWIWTADKDATGRVWFVNFYFGSCYNVSNDLSNFHVRAVRSKED